MPHACSWVQVRPPRVAESPAHFECLYHQTVVLPGHTAESVHHVVIGRVVGVHIDDAYPVDPPANGRPDPLTAPQPQTPAAVAETAAWATEYAWASAGCDPCSAEPPSDQDLVNLGFTGERTDLDTPAPAGSAAEAS